MPAVVDLPLSLSMSGLLLYFVHIYLFSPFLVHIYLFPLYLVHIYLFTSCWFLLGWTLLCGGAGAGLAADISLGAVNGAAAVKFVRQMAAAAPPLRVLVLTIKALLKVASLTPPPFPTVCPSVAQRRLGFNAASPPPLCSYLMYKMRLHVG